MVNWQTIVSSETKEGAATYIHVIHFLEINIRVAHFRMKFTNTVNERCEKVSSMYSCTDQFSFVAIFKVLQPNQHKIEKSYYTVKMGRQILSL